MSGAVLVIKKARSEGERDREGRREGECKDYANGGYVNDGRADVLLCYITLLFTDF